MSKDELAKNLGTIARSGTSEFLKKAEEGGGADGNLIGQFGTCCSHYLRLTGRAGFLFLVRAAFDSAQAALLSPSFLVSPTVRVSSLPPATSANPEPIQYTFTSSASGDSFEIFPDPRGNTLGRGTEIILEIEQENQEFLSVSNLKSLMSVTPLSTSSIGIH